MTAHPIFRGAATALITPLSESGVDYPAFGRVIDMQLNAGIDALVIAGTTGEGSTLSDKEHREVLAFAAERVNGRVPMIAGTGSNDTAYACELTKTAGALGYDGMLVVTPYYNKATQNGLVKMYHTIADSSDKPLIIYNVPSRTGVNIEPETYVKLSAHPNIRAIKEANGNISKIMETKALLGDALDIYSGNDDQIVPILSAGGAGVISVLSNVLPGETAQLCRRYFEGDTEGSLAMQLRFMPLIKALFAEVNPIPVKAACAWLGLCENRLRLPLTEIEPVHAQKLFACMEALELKEGMYA